MQGFAQALLICSSVVIGLSISAPLLNVEQSAHVFWGSLLVVLVFALLGFVARFRTFFIVAHPFVLLGMASQWVLFDDITLSYQALTLSLFLSVSIALVVAAVLFSTFKSFNKTVVSRFYRFGLAVFTVLVCAEFAVLVLELPIRMQAVSSLKNLDLQFPAFSQLNGFAVLCLFPLSLMLMVEIRLLSENTQQFVAMAAVSCVLLFVAVMLISLPLVVLPVKIRSNEATLRLAVLILCVLVLSSLSLLNDSLFSLSVTLLLWLSLSVSIFLCFALLKQVFTKSSFSWHGLIAFGLALFFSYFISVTGWFPESLEVVVQYFPAAFILMFVWLAFIFKAR